MSYAKFKNLGNQTASDQNELEQLRNNTKQNIQSNDNLIKLRSLEHKKSLIGQNRLLVVDVYGEFCNPCKMLMPEFATLASKYNQPGTCMLVKEDVEMGFSPDVTGVSTFQFYFNGRLHDSMLGADLKKVEQTILNLLQS